MIKTKSKILFEEWSCRNLFKQMQNSKQNLMNKINRKTANKQLFKHCQSPNIKVKDIIIQPTPTAQQMKAYIQKQTGHHQPYQKINMVFDRSLKQNTKGKSSKKQEELLQRINGLQMENKEFKKYVTYYHALVKRNKELEYGMRILLAQIESCQLSKIDQIQLGKNTKSSCSDSIDLHIKSRQIQSFYDEKSSNFLESMGDIKSRFSFQLTQLSPNNISLFDSKAYLNTQGQHNGSLTYSKNVEDQSASLIFENDSNKISFDQIFKIANNLKESLNILFKEHNQYSKAAVNKLGLLLCEITNDLSSFQTPLDQRQQLLNQNIFMRLKIQQQSKQIKGLQHALRLKIEQPSWINTNVKQHFIENIEDIQSFDKTRNMSKQVNKSMNQFNQHHDLIQQNNHQQLPPNKYRP